MHHAGPQWREKKSIAAAFKTGIVAAVTRHSSPIPDSQHSFFNGEFTNQIGTRLKMTRHIYANGQMGELHASLEAYSVEVEQASNSGERSR
jgi:hypothetical protein